MSAVQINSYELKKDKSEIYKIPVVNTIALHSLEDPLSEASNFMLKYHNLLFKNRRILVLGLGLGFHIHEILSFYNTKMIDDFKILVIEPCMNTIEACNFYNPIKSSKTSILYTQEVETIFNNYVSIDFLSEEFIVVIHPRSFLAYKNFFKAILSFKAAKTIGKIRENIVNENLKLFLNKYPQNTVWSKINWQDEFKNEFKDEFKDEKYFMAMFSLLV